MKQYLLKIKDHNIRKIVPQKARGTRQLVSFVYFLKDTQNRNKIRNKILRGGLYDGFL